MDLDMLANWPCMLELWDARDTSTPLILCTAPPPASRNRYHLLNRPCWEGLGGGRAIGPSEPDSGSWNWRHCWQSGRVLSPETFMLGESKGGVMFPPSVLGKGR